MKNVGVSGVLRQFAAAAIGACWLAYATPASAQLAIDKLWLDFDGEKTPRADILIRNESKDRYYIEVVASEIVAPGSEQEARVEEADPEKLGLLVTPNRLVVDPGMMRSIRIVSINSGLTKDRVYRVKILPKVGDVIAPDAGEGDRGMAIKMIAAYDVLVVARPGRGKAELAVNRTPTEIDIANNGNTNVLLFDGEACTPATEPDQKESCEKVESRRMYAGTTWKIPIKSPTAQLRFKQRKTANSEPERLTF